MAEFNYHARLTALFAALLLSACASSDGQFPSLERRPYETDEPIAEPAVAAAPIALPAELSAKVRELIARHDTSSAAFDRALPAMQRTASNAAGRAQGSEAWVDAHLKLSRLDKLRMDSASALSEFDKLIAAQAEGDSALVVLLVASQEPIATSVARQKAEVERMSKLIGE